MSYVLLRQLFSGFAFLGSLYLLWNDKQLNAIYWLIFSIGHRRGEV